MCFSDNSVGKTYGVHVVYLSASYHDNNFAAAAVFQIIHQISTHDASLFACVAWSIWKQWNNKVWHNTTKAQTSVLVRAQHCCLTGNCL